MPAPFLPPPRVPVPAVPPCFWSFARFVEAPVGDAATVRRADDPPPPPPTVAAAEARGVVAADNDGRGDMANGVDDPLPLLLLPLAIDVDNTFDVLLPPPSDNVGDDAIEACVLLLQHLTRLDLWEFFLAFFSIRIEDKQKWKLQT
jgi:hypothetical protein